MSLIAAAADFARLLQGAFAATPAQWSAFADITVAITAALGAAFLVWDRLRPRSGLIWAWLDYPRVTAAGELSAQLFALNQGAEPTFLHSIESEGGAAFALKPPNYSVASAHLARKAGLPDGQLSWRTRCEFIDRPRFVPGLGAGLPPSTLIDLFIKMPPSGQPAIMKIRFRFARDARRQITKRVEISAPPDGEA